MKNDESKLERLFAAARAADEEPAGEMPERLKTRILADWGVGSHLDEAWLAVVLLFRRALVCASIVMLAALAWTYSGSSNVPLNDEALANYDLRAQVMP